MKPQMKSRVVQMNASIEVRIRAGLKIEIDDFLQRFAVANRDVGRRRDRRKIDD